MGFWAADKVQEFAVITCYCVSYYNYIVRYNKRILEECSMERNKYPAEALTTYFKRQKQ